MVKSFLDIKEDAVKSPVQICSKAELSSIFPRPFWLAEEEISFLAQRAAEAQSTIVEIGCAYGGSTTIFLLNKKNDVHVYSIDPFVPDSKGGVRASEEDCRAAVEKALAKTCCSGAVNDWSLINGYSHNVIKSWGKEIDLLFIDGSHHYEDVKRDFEQWSRFLSPQGEILLHDSRKNNIVEDPDDKIFSRGWQGPTRFAEELKSSPDFKMVDTCYSITVFMRK